MKRFYGKTALLARLVLYMLIVDGEGGAEAYSIATKYAQAQLLFDECHNMIKQSPAMSKHIRKRKSDSPPYQNCSRFPAILTVWTD